MLNYLSADENRNFISDFYSEDERIVLILATGERYVIPYTEENLTMVEACIRRQTKEAKNYKTGLQRTKKREKFKDVFYLVLSIATFCISILGLFITTYTLINAISLIVTLASTYIFFGQSCFHGIEAKKVDKILEDIEKHEVFLGIEKSINKIVSMRNNREGISESIRPVIHLTNEETIDLSSISDASLKALRAVESKVCDEGFNTSDGASKNDSDIGTAINESTPAKVLKFAPKSRK